MKLIFVKESFDVEGPSIFLAGPTPRDEFIRSWRPEAIKIFESMGFNGTLLIPEDRTWIHQCSYDEQIEWEESGLEIADCIMFWVPREKRWMPGFTTNDEWGTWKKSGKCVWGNPPFAEKVSYQQHYAKKYNVPICCDLKSTCLESANKAKHLFENKVKIL